MNISLNRRIEALLITIGFVMTGICSGALIYISEKEQNTLDGILRLEYLIPLSVYAAGVMAILYLLFYFMKRWTVKVMAFIVSVLVGIPVGIMLMNQLIKWSIYHYSWIDILVNVY
jgi:hypothetical protein